MRRSNSIGVRFVILAAICVHADRPLAAQNFAPMPGDNQSGQETATTNSGSAEAGKIFDLDLESLSKLPVREPAATFTDPIVEAPSKSPEKASEAPGIVNVITAKDIEEFGAKNLFEVLQWATSVYMTGSFMYPNNIASMRGDLATHEGSHVLVLINGRPCREILSGGVNFPLYTAFPIHTIERIEVIRGPGSVLYGTGAFNGVINVVTKDPKEPTLHASVLGGSYGWQSYSLSAGNGNDHAGYYAGAMYNHSSGWPFSATLEDLKFDSILYSQDNPGVFAMYRNEGFAANLCVVRPNMEALGSRPAWPGAQTLATRIFTDFAYLLKLDDDHSLDTHFTYNHESFIESPGAIPIYDFIATSHSFLLESTYRAKLSDELDLLVGGTAEFHTGGGVLGPLTIIPWFENEIWYSTYLQLEYQATEWLKLIGGMQGNMPGAIPGGIVPRAGVIASLHQNWTAKFLYGEAFRSPDNPERNIYVPFVVVGNPDLVPEVIQTFDAQLAYHTESYRFAATYFHSDYFNSIVRTGKFPETYVNISGLKFQGVELENEWRLSDRWRWLGSVTYQNNTYDGEANVTAAPIWMAKMGAVYRNGRGLQIALMDVFYGARKASDEALPVNPDADAYHLASLNTTLDLDRRFNWQTGRKMQLQFLIQNLFNESTYDVEFQRKVINTLPAGPGRTYYGGFTMAY